MGSITSLCQLGYENDTWTLRLGPQKTRLSQFGFIQVRGEDASLFLQSLLTSDVRQINSERGQFSSWCDGKGRIQAAFWLLPFKDAIYLIVPLAMVAGLIARLRMFVLRAKVTLRDATDDMALIGLVGPLPDESSIDSQTILHTPGAVTQISDCAVMSIHGTGVIRYLALGSQLQIQQLSQHVFKDLPEVSESLWPLLDIFTGIPHIEEATTGEFIPQMLSLEALGALSFNKGCYPGQEVVARLQYRGQLKRKMYRAIVVTNEVPPPGTRLAGPDTQESIGQVLAAERLDSETVLVQVVVVIERKESNAVHLAALKGPRLCFEPDEGVPQSGETLNVQ